MNLPNQLVGTLRNSFLFVALCLTATALSAQSLAPAGHWKGKLSLPGGVQLLIVFHITQEEEAGWKATFDSPDQMVYGIKFDEVTLDNQQVRLRNKAAGIVYKGKIVEQGQAIDGSWKQGGAEFPLRITPTEHTVPKRPQTPKGPFPYDIETVEFSNPNANITLAGTLTLPENKQNCPAVILISGSGPQDRNSSILQHQPFWVLADYLSRQGMVVLRVDDRGVGESGGTFAGATSADFATDVEAAFEYLKKHPRVNSNKVGLMGHSEGGAIAPVVASRNKDVAFVVLLAGPGEQGSKVLAQQNYDLFLQETQSTELANYRRQFFEKIYNTVNQEANKDKGNSAVYALLEKDLNQLSSEERTQIDLEEKNVRAMIALFRSPWMRYFLAMNPQEYLSKIHCPVLAINGEKDLQVHPDNLKAIEKALKEGKNNKYQILVFPDLNHLLQTSETGAVDEYAEIEETISPKVLTAINAWLKQEKIYE
jgi:pimeloyl-ACP methyl ester carboxylesterase